MVAVEEIRIASYQLANARLVISKWRDAYQKMVVARAPDQAK